ncbi:MAG: MliC family protein, partial [Brevundimonas sp.]
MRRLIALSLIPALVAACSREDAQPPRPVEPAPAPATPAVPAVGYACESGQTVSVAYGADETARLTYQGQAYDLRLAPSGSGARYT